MAADAVSGLDTLALRLVSSGVLAEDDLSGAQRLQNQLGGSLTSAVLRGGFASEETLLPVLSEYTGVPIYASSERAPSAEAIESACARLGAPLPWFVARDAVPFLGAGDEIIYGVSVTNADVIMSDGKSLENSAVHPDVLINPSAADLAAGADPVLAEALRMLGNPISPADAGKLFRLRWTENPRGDDLIEIVTK